MFINEIYTLVVVILRLNGLIDWTWSAILLPELVWLAVYLITAITLFIGVRTVKDEEILSKDDWRGLD